MNDALKAVIELMKQDPRTSWLALVVVGLIAGGKALSEFGAEPWGTCVTGLGGFIAGIALLISKLAKKDPPPPSAGSSTEPPHA